MPSPHCRGPLHIREYTRVATGMYAGRAYVNTAILQVCMLGALSYLCCIVLCYRYVCLMYLRKYGYSTRMYAGCLTLSMLDVFTCLYCMFTTVCVCVPISLDTCTRMWERSVWPIALCKHRRCAEQWLSSSIVPHSVDAYIARLVKRCALTT